MGWDYSTAWELAVGWDDDSFEVPPTPEPLDIWGPPSISFTKPFAKNANTRDIEEFSRRFRSVCQYFPEAQGEIRVGLTTSYKGLSILEFGPKGKRLKLSFPSLRRSGIPTHYVIGHELMHFVQNENNLPRTERSCDIHTLARLPPRLLDHPPIYLKIPPEARRKWCASGEGPVISEIAHSLAGEILQNRSGGSRYIVKWEKEFARQIEGLY